MTDLRKIPIWPKNTGAGTQYWEMADEDRAWLLEHMTRFMAAMSELITYDNDLRAEILRRRGTGYPRGRMGPNSHASMLGGVIMTLLDGRDITTPQLDAIETLTDLISVYSNTEAARFSRRIWSRDD